MHCFVMQPDGKIAIWSTIVDDFMAFDLSRDEALEYEMGDFIQTSGYPGGKEKLKSDLEDGLKNMDIVGVSWDWSPDWNECIRRCKQFKNHESLKFIEEQEMPHRMKPIVSPLRAMKYWRNYWREKCERLELAAIRAAEEAEDANETAR